MMDDSTLTILKNVLARHGTELLDDQRRCENVLKENFPAEAQVEVRALMAALTYGIPARLSGMPAGSLTSAAINNCAASVAANTGLRDDLARWAVAAWAFALELPVADGKIGQDRDGKAAAKPDVGASPAKPAWSRRRWLALGGGAFAVLLIAVFLNSNDGTGVPQNAGAITWRTFTNQKLGTTAEFPNWFVSDPSVGDTATDSAFDTYLKAPDGATMVISAAGAAGTTAAALVDNILKQPDVADVKITDKKQGDRWVWIEGTGSNQTFYYEIDVLSRQGKILNVLIVRCPASVGEQYNGIVSHMWETFIARNP
jgi:hypothetical protein